ncbi:hypothetical protein CAter282_0857 [Collimonas arenae]|uniref:Uncharacterized protein n=1 Tax=Collimonas arenae TaxID=279058 RepID=A0A127QF18_9BURK|nr:hypothetical protein CAter10_0930 [Collimonas arenae]AMP08657.1 hypothetical protein CAter282_0857 [Collimonas arenae]
MLLLPTLQRSLRFFEFSFVLDIFSRHHFPQSIKDWLSS